MTELQTLIRDSNGMPPVIRADYLEDHGYDLEADWVHRGEFRRNPRLVTGYADGRGLYVAHGLEAIHFSASEGFASNSLSLKDGAAWSARGWAREIAGHAAGTENDDQELRIFVGSN